MSERMLFDSSGRLVATDYYQSEDFVQGRPCCAVRDGVWHLLMPGQHQVMPPRKRVYVLPVTCSSEPVGWRWKLWLSPTWTLPLPLSCFLPPCPELPEPGTMQRRQLRVYGYWLPGMRPVTWSFGLVQTAWPEVIHDPTLVVVRAPRGFRAQPWRW